MRRTGEGGGGEIKVGNDGKNVIKKKESIRKRVGIKKIKRGETGRKMGQKREEKRENKRKQKLKGKMRFFMAIAPRV